MTWLVIVGAVLLAIFAWRFHREPRRLSNGALLLLGAGAFLLGAFDDVGLKAVVFLVVISPVLMLGLGVLLVVNGIIVLRRERARLSNALTLLAGVGILGLIAFVPISFVIANDAENYLFVLPALSLLAAFGYIGLVFTLVTFYALVYSRISPRPGSAAIIVLGSSVPGRSIPPLLASRLDKAAELYRREVAAGHRPVLVTSGGQGIDEPVPEAEAMAAYLSDAGVPADALIEERRSTSTRENLVFSRTLLDERGANGRLLVVTSSYHVLRAALQTRRLRLPAQVAGAKTARYYVPNAFLREFVALLADHKLLHGLMIVVLIALPAQGLLR